MSDSIETRWEQHNEAGRVAFTDGDFARAEQSFLAAIREATQLGADNVRLASSLSNLGQLKYKQKDFAQAEALFHRALAIRERVLGPEHFGLVQNINNLAALHYARGELDQAEPLFQRALGISQQHLGEGHPDVAVTLNNLARLYFRRNDYASAGPLLSRLLVIKEQALGASHPEIAAILTSLAKVRLHQKDYEGGEQFARRALGIREKLQLPNDLAVATALETLADIAGACGRTDEELAQRQRALDVRTGAMGADHPMVVAARTALEARRSGGAPAKTTAPAPAPKPAAASKPAAPPPLALQELHFEAPQAAAPPAPAPPPTAPAQPSRSAAPPWFEAPDLSSFERTGPRSVPRDNGTGATITLPMPSGSEISNGAGVRSVAASAVVVESPFMLHPTAAAPAAPIAPRVPTPAAPSPAPVLDSGAQSQFTDSFARLVAETPSGRQAIVQDEPLSTQHIEEPRPEISLDWPLEARRPWIKIAGAAAAVSILVGGGWYYFSHKEASPGSSAAQAVAPSTKPNGANLAAATNTLAVRHDPALSGPPASVVKPGATTAIVPTTKSSKAMKDEGPPPDAKQATHEDANESSASTSKVPDTDSNIIRAPKLPNIKVDAITKLIDDSARRRADSVGRVIQEKPPTFKPKVYKAPE